MAVRGFGAQRWRPPAPALGGEAIRYTLNRWDELGHFLENAGIPLDNNPAEAALRRVALGRTNFLFVGSVESGVKLGGLYSLVARCEANNVNPTRVPRRRARPRHHAPHVAD